MDLIFNRGNDAAVPGRKMPDRPVRAVFSWIGAPVG